MIVYGIKNCDKVRAVIKQLKADGVNHQLHDFRVDGVDDSLVQAMLNDIEMKQLLNKRSTTWKQLAVQDQEAVNVSLLVAHPTLIKRPVIYTDGQYRIGL